MDTSIYVQRTKNRRLLTEGMREVNEKIKAACQMKGVKPFHFKYTQHMIDNIAVRNININQLLRLLSKCVDHVHVFQEYFDMEQRPLDEALIDSNKTYRPTRFELTDGELWIGMTPFVTDEFALMTCRMVIVNDSRLPSRVACKLLKVD